MGGYTVSQLAELSGVSVRTLHHYDHLGLLRPASIGVNGYRYYGRGELLRLQQIMFHRELGFSLDEIGKALDEPGFDRVAALQAHRARLTAEARRYRRLVRTIDETLAVLQGAATMDDKRMYQGFTLSEGEEAQIEAWLTSRFGSEVQTHIEQARAAMAEFSPKQLEAARDKMNAFYLLMAKALREGAPAGSDAVQALVRDHWAGVARGWGVEPSRGPFEHLRIIYREQPVFRAKHEALDPALPDYLAEAMRVYGEQALA